MTRNANKYSQLKLTYLPLLMAIVFLSSLITSIWADDSIDQKYSHYLPGPGYSLSPPVYYNYIIFWIVEIIACCWAESVCIRDTRKNKCWSRCLSFTALILFVLFVTVVCAWVIISKEKDDITWIMMSGGKYGDRGAVEQVICNIIAILTGTTGMCILPLFWGAPCLIMFCQKLSRHTLFVAFTSMLLAVGGPKFISNYIIPNEYCSEGEIQSSPAS